MELRHLRYFVAVAEAGSLTVAAEQRLHTSQPSLSRQIRDLEGELGAQLLTRRARGIELTPAGRAFLDHARRALQKYEVIWNGQGGTDIFFQNEMPYDPPSQEAWMEAPGVDGWAAFKVADHVSSFSGYGMGSYSFFNQGVPILAASAFEVPSNLPAESMHDLLTIFLSTAGSGGILNVINNIGGSSTIANPDTPVTVVSYP
jgi:Bacterial regulatory helix-turn-helix protein, lysR family